MCLVAEKEEENERNEGKENQRENSRPVLCMSSIKNESPLYKICFKLIYAQESKKTIKPSIPIIYEGKNWKKKSQKVSQTGPKGQAAFLHPSKLLDFPYFFALLSF